ncbi:hypothetical protein ACFFLZ_00850 [Photobacterium aphoticum]|uniref:Uncharacterized protein n=1 Tax=Photobacterium aphoticum TaxID=754436 RepID=A0A090QKD2_9GAMM|nr:hypothetical protein [Photobacterium aphoticum]KLU99807.1 hypothetical protein ABT58_15140 [Photobacterium aphoticum]PSU59507.1 hypothetical protein C9I90_03260 [Photobacterium aphoticum]GAL03371.1 hypothetical protein JCM19237_6264 [Photobacterium aphoticum]GHA40180.1 hypothetical protein GCM10007086_12070 [Photobacterium aphoticum]
MYVITEHEILDPEAFWHQASGVFTHPPHGIRLHTAMVVERETLCQCMWESASLDAVRDYLEPALGKASNNTYGEVDPDIAIR